jgi:flagellar basal-body rod protein FlgB
MIDATVDILQRSLDLHSQAHEVHSSNIANANVPQYKAKKIDFEQRMREAIEKIDGDQPLLAKEKDLTKEILQVSPDVYEDPLAVMKGDGNSVDMEKEQTALAKNTIGYQAAIQLINKKFAMEKMVLTEGGR